MKFQMRKYQNEGVALMEYFRGRVLLGDEMGLGKTIEVLAFLQKRVKIRPVIVICPAGVKYVWEREALTKFNMRSFVCEGTKPPRRGFNRIPPLVIINYKILEPWLKWIVREFAPRCVVMDECHYIKNPDSLRTRMVKEIARRCDFRIGVSGTPQMNRPAELWPVLNLIDPDTYDSMFVFGQMFCRPVLEYGKWQYKGAKNLPKLHAQLRSRCMIRRLKKDVLGELPAKVRQVIPLELKRRNEYIYARDNFLKWLEEQSPEKMKRAARALAITRIGYLKRLAVRLKIGFVVDWVKDFLEQSEGKLVLMGEQRKGIEYLKRKFPNSLVIDGKVKGKDRQAVVDVFQRNDKYRILIGNRKAAGIGITLTAASTMAFYELGWTPAEHTQAEDRIHRYGQDQTAMIKYLIARDTIEENICQIIQSKQVVNKATLDGGEASADDLEIYSILINQLTGVAA